jgi:hypothetical protein
MRAKNSSTAAEAVTSVVWDGRGTLDPLSKFVHHNQNVDVALESLRQGAQKVLMHSLYEGTCMVPEHLRFGMVLGALV